MTTASQGRILWHGTTKRRAEAILANGPDPRYREQGGQPDPEEIAGFSTALPHVDCLTGNPKICARNKDRIFPNEGGPAILEIEVPEDICTLAIRVFGGELRFQFGDGLEELLEHWPELPKRIL